MDPIDDLLAQINEGSPLARVQLYERLYQDLRRLARSRLRGCEPITLLDTSGLVHEAYLRFLQAGRLAFPDRGHFFAFAASVMRSLVVDALRRRHAQRRGDGADHVTLDDEIVDGLAADDDEALRVHEALQDLKGEHGRIVQVVEMRYFAGLGDCAIADALGVTARTVRRDWEKARALLFAALR